MARTLVLLKPDAVRRGLVGALLSRFEDKGLTIVAMEHRTIDAALSGSALHEGLKQALRRDAAFTAALASLLSAAFDRAALDQARGDGASARQAMRWLVERLVADQAGGAGPERWRQAA